MARLFVHVEGPTEETFVNQLLRPHLIAKGFHSVSAKLLGNSRARINRGGIKPWPGVRSDILRHLKSDAAIYSTLMVDYYALPALGEKAWPGRDAPVNLPAGQKGKHVEESIGKAIAAGLGVPPEQSRFIPYIMMYEFEALLFSDCAAFARGIGMPELEPKLKSIRTAFATPEEINDSPITAPSKRVTGLIPGYQKPLFGNSALAEIGLDAVRSECKNFDNWLCRLELIVA